MTPDTTADGRWRLWGTTDGRHLAERWVRIPGRQVSVRELLTREQAAAMRDDLDQILRDWPPPPRCAHRIGQHAASLGLLYRTRRFRRFPCHDGPEYHPEGDLSGGPS